MIGNLNKKDKIALIYLTILTGIAVGYGFSIIPSPTKEQAIATDQKRVSDLSAIQASIDSYYQNNNALPQSLDDLVTSPYDTSTNFGKTDPQTKQPYNYVITGPYRFKLCTTFTFDSKSEQADSYDTTVVSYPVYGNQFNHPAGYYCFTKTEKVNNYLPTYNPPRVELPQYKGTYPTPSVSTSPYPTVFEQPNTGSNF